MAVAARDIKRATEFAEKHQIGQSYGSYEQLAEDPQVEIAYVGVTALQHLEVVKTMLNAGKLKNLPNRGTISGSKGIISVK